jgi:hypothetical protein
VAIPYADWSSQTETCPAYVVGSSRLDSLMETGAITTEVPDRMLSSPAKRRPVAAASRTYESTCAIQ